MRRERSLCNSRPSYALLCGLLSLGLSNQPLFAADEPLRIHMIGTGEYEAAESLAKYKIYLEEKYHVVVEASLGKEKTLTGLDRLKSADLLILFARRMNLPAEHMKLIREHCEGGKPLVALRTASHAFQTGDNEWIARVIGGKYTGPGSYTAPFTAVPTEAEADHPVLHGVGAIESKGAYGFAPLAPEARVLQIVASEKKVKQPATWVHEYRGGRTFYSTLGRGEDFQNPAFRRLLENAVFWTAKREAERLLRDRRPVSHLEQNRAESIAGVTTVDLQNDEPSSVDFIRDVQPILARHCVKCHGSEERQSELRLDSASGVRRGGNSGPAVVAGKSGESLLIHAIRGDENVAAMPPKGPRLSPAEIDVVRRWIDSGLPATETAPVAAERVRSDHWAFQPPVRPAEPTVRNRDWVRTPIDRFLLAQLESAQIEPAPEADRATLVRRLSLDLIGLPPTPAETESAVNDPSPLWYERVVDRLLASSHYGERWGRHWLDLARYADSNGFNFDYPRSIWKYRDWVIEALNCDLPFDRFTIEQLAGDLLPSATLEQKIATGFHRNTTANDEAGSDAEQFRIERVVDRTNTTGAVWLGLTVGCAQCHDHKYDPISQREYYQLFAYFNVADEVQISVPTPEATLKKEALQAQVDVLQRELRDFVEKLAEQQVEWEASLTDGQRATLPAEIRAILARQLRNATQQKTLTTYFNSLDDGFLERTQRLEQLKKELAAGVTTLGLREGKRTTNVLLRGDFLRPGIAVEAGVPSVLPAVKAGGNRLDLAHWLVDPRHPLTARVTVNRIWQQYFGIGLVETENDFGVQGTPPSHPELLDWLATEFIRLNWSLKSLHRLIVQSAVYRQSSHWRPEVVEVDPHNRRLARQNRLRLEAEIVRDTALSVSGLLDPTIGGPSVFPPQPAGLGVFTRTPKTWTESQGVDRYRRGMYTHFWRSIPYPAYMVFDAPDAQTACTRRNRTNTPLQALTLANDPVFVECAQALAERILREGGTSTEERLRYAFRLCLGREANEADLKPMQDLLAEKPDAWPLVGRVLLNLDEFITRE